MMKHKIFYLTILMISNGLVLTGQKNINPSQRIKIPDSLKLSLLTITYGNTEKLTRNTGLYIFNLQNYKNYDFKNGLYSFKGMGPHFPRRIFIKYNDKYYIFNKIGAFDDLGLLKEFIDSTKILSVSGRDRLIYLRALAKYLEEEFGLTYGTEIKLN